MMNQERLYDLIINILDQVDEEEYPETIEIAEQCIIPEAEIILEEAYDIALQLMDADTTKVMPQQVADFMAEVLLAEIKCGNYGAATDLGALYYTGRIGVQDYTEAMRYYQIAADHGDVQAQENLGYCYYYGRNVEKDYEKAYHYFSLGAFAGLIGSLYKIGDMFRYGYYVEQNEEEAFIIYKRCLNELDDNTYNLFGGDIMLRMADCLFEGIGTEINYADALMFYQKAELLFLDRLKTGDFMIRNNYEKAIARQQEARAKAQEELPEYQWTK